MKVVSTEEFNKQTKNLDGFLKIKLDKQVKKMENNPDVGKPLKHLKGERALYIKPFRLIYYYSKEKDILFLLKFDHRENIYST